MPVNPFALLPQPAPQDTESPAAIHKWLYKVWLKLRNTDTDLPATNTLATSGQAAATDAQTRVGMLEGQNLNTRIDTIEQGSQWPIGCYHFNNGADPATTLGFGTWSMVSQGQFIAGYKSGDADFGTIGGTGGNKTVSHTNNHSVTQPDGHSDHGTTAIPQGTGATVTVVTGKTHDNNHAGTAVAAHADHNILNPFFTLCVWERTA
jgi:hypothetical protein